MTNEMTVLNNGNGNMVKFSIPENILDAAAKQLGGSGNYASVEKTGGYNISGVEKVVPEMRGIITDLQLCQGKFEGGRMSKLPYDGMGLSEGYTLRGDLTVQINPSFVLLMSLSPTSLKGAISYVRSLQNQGISPNQVCTIFRTKSVVGKNGAYSIATFESAPLPTPAAAQPEMRNITPPAAFIPTPAAFTPPAPAAPAESALPAGWE
jgi:hypothetical protein